MKKGKTIPRDSCIESSVNLVFYPYRQGFWSDAERMLPLHCS